MIKYKFKSEEKAVEAQKEILDQGYKNMTEVRWDCIYTLQDLTADQTYELGEIVKKYGGQAQLVLGVL